MSRFDWPAIMQVGMRETGLRPDEFWALTPSEFWLVTGRGPTVTVMRRDRLDELMATYPDGKERGGT